MRLELSDLGWDEQSARRARELVTCFLGELGWDALIPVAALLASELATNSYRHSHGPIRLSGSGAGETLRIEVYDTSRVLASMRDPDDRGGRGLHIVDGFATAWGSSRTNGTGKVTWFELRQE